MKRLILAATVAALVGNVSCSSKDTGSGAVEGATTGDAQTPPTGEAAVESWLAGKMYNAWKCEPTPHAPRPPSPHGNDRICSNDLLSKHEGGGEYPIGAAGVKELYDGNEIIGYAVYRKIANGGGESWYWYEKIRGGLNADGTGGSGEPKEVCVGCHSRAANDFVFTQVR